MKKILALVGVLSVAVVCGGVSLARADCAAHKTQAAVENATPAKNVASSPAADKVVTDQVQTVQAQKPAPLTPEVKK